MAPTLSSEYQSLFIEAIDRKDSQIGHADFRGTISEHYIRSYQKSPYLCLLLSWRQKSGSQNIRQYVMSLLPEQCSQANNTRGFCDLLDHECAVALIKKTWASIRREPVTEKTQSEERRTLHRPGPEPTLSQQSSRALSLVFHTRETRWQTMLRRRQLMRMASALIRFVLNLMLASSRLAVI